MATKHNYAYRNRVTTEPTVVFPTNTYKRGKKKPRPTCRARGCQNKVRELEDKFCSMKCYKASRSNGPTAYKLKTKMTEDSSNDFTKVLAYKEDGIPVYHMKRKPNT